MLKNSRTFYKKNQYPGECFYLIYYPEHGPYLTTYRKSCTNIKLLILKLLYLMFSFAGYISKEKDRLWHAEYLKYCKF